MHLKLEMQLNLVPKSRQIVPSQKSSASIVHTRLYQHQNWTDMRKRQLAWILSYTVETDPVKTVHSLLGKLKMILNLRLHFKFKNTSKHVAHPVSLCSSQWFKSVATDCNTIFQLKFSRISASACGVTCYSSRTVVVIKLQRTSALVSARNLYFTKI